MLNVVGRSSTNDAEYAEAFTVKLENIASQWRSSLERASQFNDAEKILIEEIKLTTADEMIRVIKKMTEQEA